MMRRVGWLCFLTFNDLDVLQARMLSLEVSILNLFLLGVWIGIS